MFNYREFLKKGFLDAVGKMADYQIRLNAAGYYEKGVLTDEDLAEIDAAIEAQYIVPEPEIVPGVESGTGATGDGETVVDPDVEVDEEATPSEEIGEAAVE